MTRETEELLQSVLLEALEYLRALNEEVRRDRYERQRSEAYRKKGYNLGQPWRRRWRGEF